METPTQKPEPNYHFVSDKFTESLKEHFGPFDLRALVENAVQAFEAQDFELQEWGPTLRFNLYRTPDMGGGKPQKVVHIELWINAQGSGKAELRVYVVLEEIDLDKASAVVEKYGGKITSQGQLACQLEIPIELQEGRTEEVGIDAKSIWDEIRACSK